MRIGFDSMQQYRVKFILARITKYVDVRRKNGGDASNVAEFYEGGIEIEHIMPQKYSAAYGISEDDYNAAKQRLGNLTLLEKTINASIGDDAFASKSKAYRQSAYYLTRSIAQLDDVGQQTAINRMNQKLRSWSSWGPSMIEDRQAILYDLSEEIWNID